MIKLEQIKNKISINVATYIDSIFSEIEENSKELDVVIKELRKKRIAFIDLTNEYDIVSEELTKDREETNRSRADLIIEENRILNSKTKLEKESKRLVKEIKGLESSIKSLEKSKTNLKFESTKLDTIKKIKEETEKELFEIRLNFKEDSELFDKELDRLAGVKQELELEIKKIVEDKAKELTSALPTIESLNTKAKQLNRREAALTILEKRLKYRYANK